MLADGNVPRVGNDAVSLGVRCEDGSGHADIEVFEGGVVRPGIRGMSVVPSLERLPRHRVPRTLKSVLEGARGRVDLICWRMGEGSFVESPVASGLFLVLDPQRPTEHGLIVPTVEMLLSLYRAALAETQAQWIHVPWPKLEEGK